MDRASSSKLPEETGTIVDTSLHEDSNGEFPEYNFNNYPWPGVRGSSPPDPEKSLLNERQRNYMASSQFLKQFDQDAVKRLFEIHIYKLRSLGREEVFKRLGPKIRIQVGPSGLPSRAPSSPISDTPLTVLGHLFLKPKILLAPSNFLVAFWLLSHLTYKLVII